MHAGLYKVFLLLVKVNRLASVLFASLQHVGGFLALTRRCARLEELLLSRPGSTGRRAMACRSEPAFSSEHLQIDNCQGINGIRTREAETDVVN